MKTRIVTFFIGILLFYQLPTLPERNAVLVLVGLLLLSLSHQHSRILAFLIGGFLWAFIRADGVLSHQLPTALEGQDLMISGRVVDLPLRDDNKQKFTFKVASIKGVDSSLNHPYLLSLNWYDNSYSQQEPLRVSAGEQWQFTVRLKRPSGFMNPGVHDYEASLFKKGINATGYIKHGTKLSVTPSSAIQYVHVWRAKLYEHLNEALDETNGVISALGLGIKSDISQADWETLRHTGTIHLTAISGLHISLVAALAFFLGRWLWSLPIVTLRFLAAFKAGAILSISAAFLYAALAGFSIPTQRAFIMVAVMMLCLLSDKEISKFDIFFIALFSVLFFSPASIIAQGFWLSFAAVAVIFYCVCGRVQLQNKVKTSLKMHFILALGLSPILILLFGQNPILGPIANIIAVPFFTLLITPLVLLGILFSTLSHDISLWILNLTECLIQWFWPILEGIASVPFSRLNGHFSSTLAFVLCLIAVIILLMPKGIPGRWLAVIFILPAFLVRTPSPNEKNFTLTMLDVGQGLAVVVRTHNHTLLYDTGAKFSENFDMGKMVVLPYLKANDVTHLDMVMLSHSDNDHAGSYGSISEGIGISKTVSSQPEQFPDLAINTCRAGLNWRWDGVSFEVLSPSSVRPSDEQHNKAYSDNNESCVLKIDNGYRSVLLTGDIEKETERRLIHEQSPALDVDILFAPHHGSNTSSTQAFIKATSAQYVLCSAGYRNRFNHPAEKVEKRYSDAGLRLLTTNNEGAVSFHISDTISEPMLYRQKHSHFWNRNHVE